MVQLEWSPQGTQRNLSVPMGLEIQGKSCTGAQRPTQIDPMFDSSQYAQGSKVDLDYFYDAAAATSPLNVASPAKQALVMQKTRSRNVVNGDKYYFAGKQHYDTTHRDTFVAYANEDGDFGELPPCPTCSLFVSVVRARTHVCARCISLARPFARLFSLFFSPSLSLSFFVSLFLILSRSHLILLSLDLALAFSRALSLTHSLALSLALTFSFSLHSHSFVSLTLSSLSLSSYA
jgi:hypothetical protein